MSRSRHRAGVWLSLVIGLTVAGCGHKAAVLAPDSSAPALSLAAERVATEKPGVAAFRVRWNLTAGVARQFVYAVNPADRARVDQTWKTTGESFAMVEVPVSGTESGKPGSPGAPTTIVVRAVDRTGRMSEPATLSFVDGNIAPTVQITAPVPNDRQRTYLPPDVTIRWQGADPDGTPRPYPVEYRWTLLNRDTPVSFATALVFPDTVRRYYEPRGYADWVVAPVGSQGEGSVTLHDLVVTADYMFVVVAKDDQGTWSPIFSMATNMLNFRVISGDAGGPALTLFNDSFFYQYATGTYTTDPGAEIPLQVATGTRFAVHWFGTPVAGATVAGYRYGLDLADPMGGDGGARPGDERSGWSPLSPSRTSVTLGPFGGGETHRLYIEAIDSNGLRSLGILRIGTVEFRGQRPLLVVNDTRLPLDQRSPSSPDCIDPPRGRWPYAAELDSFLFARGGFPWKCYPAGTRSTPGLFAGYDFDTMGTRGLPDGTVPLSVLSHYERVLWLVDSRGAVNSGPPNNLTEAMSSMRSMSQPGHQNTLAQYVQAGGQAWVAGGGGLTAATLPYNRLNNDVTPPVPGLTFTAVNGELDPGRFAYDVAGWQTGFKVSYSPVHFSRYLGRHEGTGSVYEGLPEAMRPKSAASDPFPPNRTLSYGDFYAVNFAVEYLFEGEQILNRETRGHPGAGGSAMDTLYKATGVALVPPQLNPTNVVMTRYYGASRNNPVLVSGFDLWSFTRDDCKAMVDFVLQRLWGMQPEAVVNPAPRLAHASP